MKINPNLRIGSVEEVEEYMVIIKDPSSTELEVDKAKEQMTLLFDVYIDKFVKFFKGEKTYLGTKDMRQFAYSICKERDDFVRRHKLIVKTLEDYSREDIKSDLTELFLNLIRTYKKVEGVDALGYIVRFYKLRIISWYKALVHQKQWTFCKTMYLDTENKDVIIEYLLEKREQRNKEINSDDYFVEDNLDNIAKLIKLRSLTEEEVKELKNNVDQPGDQARFFLKSTSVKWVQSRIDNIIENLEEQVADDEFFSELELTILHYSNENKTNKQIAELVGLTQEQVGIELRLIKDMLEELK